MIPSRSIRLLYLFGTALVFPALSVLSVLAGQLRPRRFYQHCPADPFRANLFVPALLFVEDRRFFLHRGIDFFALVRAFWWDLRHRKMDQGGSTITQQLVKNLFYGPEAPRSIRRKISEMEAAILIESIYSKNDILRLYSNVVCWGFCYGLEFSALSHFGKLPENLTANESIALVTSLYGAKYLQGQKKIWEKLQLPVCRHFGVEEKALTPTLSMGYKDEPDGCSFKKGDQDAVAGDSAAVRLRWADREDRRGDCTCHLQTRLQGKL